MSQTRDESVGYGLGCFVLLYTMMRKKRRYADHDVWLANNCWLFLNGNATEKLYRSKKSSHRVRVTEKEQLPRVDES